MIEITAIPASNLFSQEVKQSLQHIFHGFQGLLNQLYALAMGQNASIEIVFLSGEPSQNNSNNPFRIIAIVRSDANNELVNHLISALTNHLRMFNYIIKELDCGESEAISAKLMHISSANLLSVIKSEKMVSSTWSYTGYYYYADVMRPSDSKQTDNFSSLLKTLNDIPHSYVAFQLMPSQLQPQEEFALRDLANGLPQTVQGIFSRGEMIREAYAEAPYQCYDYYSQRIGQPMFIYNLIAGSLSNAYPLATQIISSLQTALQTQVNFEILDLVQQQRLQFNFAFFPWQISNLVQQYYRNPAIWNGNLIAPTNLSRLPFWVSAEEAALFFKLPIDDATVSGIESNMLKESSEMLKETVTDKENIAFGFQKGNSTVNIGASTKAFTQHATIVGVPGTGKTTFAINLLMQFHQKGIPFLAIEPTKKEYRAMVSVIPELQIFTPGNNSVSPFIINPFIPPRDVTVEEYIPSLANAFGAAFSMPEPLDIIFLSAIKQCYTEHGWRDYSKYGDPNVVPFGLYEFILTFNRIVSEANYSKDVKGNLQSGGTFRLMNLLEQNGNIYDTVNTVPLEDILARPTVIELNAIDNEEFKSLLMALLLINICVYAKHHQQSDGVLKNVLLIDEAHVLLDSAKSSTQSKNDISNPTIKALQNMVAEIRALGTSIIIADQSPRKIGKDIIDNTDIKVSFRLVGSEAREIIADSTDMDEYKKQYLSHLDSGEAFVYYRGLKNSQLIVTPDIRKQLGVENTTTDSVVANANGYWLEKKHLLIPHAECKYSELCRGACDFKVRADADYYANYIFNTFGAKISDKEKLIKYIYVLHELVIQYEKNNRDKSNLKQLCNCTKIKFLRKMQLAKPFLQLSKTEVNRLLKYVMLREEA